jgi:hypothetical protein
VAAEYERVDNPLFHHPEDHCPICHTLLRTGGPTYALRDCPLCPEPDLA